jgi:hypothetical protein
VVPVWIFVICSQLYLFYVRKLIDKLNVFNFVAKNNTNIQRIFDILQSLKQLYLAADLLHRHFSTILMVNCFMTFITMLTTTYNVIDFFQRGNMVLFCWDSSDVIDSFIRFCLICHTSDRIREAVIIILLSLLITLYLHRSIF